jgi:hypothetical protein
MRCGETGSSENPVLSFHGESLYELYPSEHGSKHYCVKCLIKMFTEKMSQLERELRETERELKTRKNADAIADRLLKEVVMKRSVSLTENIIIYARGDKYFLKVTDFEKGYWAQVPLDEMQLRAVLKFFETLARSGGAQQGAQDITSFIG